MRISDPDCEPPATLTPLLNDGDLITGRTLMQDQGFVMWSFNVAPAKCLPLMSYASTVSGTGVSSGAVVTWNSQRVFKFPWVANHLAVGPYTVSVTATTWEGSAQSLAANVWSRSVTLTDPCPSTALTVDNTDIPYVLN